MLSKISFRNILLILTLLIKFGRRRTLLNQLNFPLLLHILFYNFRKVFAIVKVYSKDITYKYI